MGRENAALPLFRDGTGMPERADDAPLEIIRKNLAAWERLERRIALRKSDDPRRLHELGRDLRSIRDCYVAASHPRVRRALLCEAARLTRQMKTIAGRMRCARIEALEVA